LSSEQREKVIEICQEMATKYPKSNLLKLLPIEHTAGQLLECGLHGLSCL
jgi:hypothetical protein